MNYFPILDSKRSNNTDCRFFGMAFLYNIEGKIKGKTSCAKFYLRSMLKPVQASVLPDDAIKKYGFSDEELAIMQASHAGEKVHTNLVKSILNKINRTENELLCPVIPPLNTKEHQNYSKIHNNCSGKHALMLALCDYFGYETSNYNDFNHPLQKMIKEKVLYYAKTNDFIISKDGCTLPIMGLKIDDIAKLFLNYYADKNNSRLISAYKNNPYIIGGSDNFSYRTDTKIMKLSENLFSKVGAGGFIYVYNKEKKEILIVKMAQDNNPQREIVTLEILYNLGWLKERFYDNKIYTEDNLPIGQYFLNEWEN